MGFANIYNSLSTVACTESILNACLHGSCLLQVTELLQPAMHPEAGHSFSWYSKPAIIVTGVSQELAS